MSNKDVGSEGVFKYEALTQKYQDKFLLIFQGPHL